MRMDPEHARACGHEKLALRTHMGQSKHRKTQLASTRCLQLGNKNTRFLCLHTPLCQEVYRPEWNRSPHKITSTGVER